ncbi:hypothetical protein ACIGCH_15860 [Pseudomonas helleri]|uniref:Uncharacterized protein n=1 Tax=Pseudomonas helleri TaxID=1608996 RepID=A0A6A7YV01_9PSED|nr:hypothetical protein [Pseudomonas helleri]MQT27807.1 hypothetical protein [Pseudomonas helleri]MQT79357.1 hypothetical protein [Pseudomonas helleri]MQU16126.1 hypothetical protein [Pseudomonas helleri]MQU29024.1 hypothetical protein [Pseudomonas helleri]
MFDLTNVGYVKRIMVGSTDPEKLTPDAAVQAQAALLNRCLTETPRGRIVGIEKNFTLLNIGEHQVVLQALIYHLGFARKPHWLAGDEESS